MTAAMTDADHLHLDDDGPLSQVDDGMDVGAVLAPGSARTPAGSAGTSSTSGTDSTMATNSTTTTASTTNSKESKESKESNIRVCVRVRPMHHRDLVGGGGGDEDRRMSMAIGTSVGSVGSVGPTGAPVKRSLAVVDERVICFDPSDGGKRPFQRGVPTHDNKRTKDIRYIFDRVFHDDATQREVRTVCVVGWGGVVSRCLCLPVSLSRVSVSLSLPYPYPIPPPLSLHPPLRCTRIPSKTCWTACSTVTMRPCLLTGYVTLRGRKSVRCADQAWLTWWRVCVGDRCWQDIYYL